jgi:hypothetical protein
MGESNQFDWVDFYKELSIKLLQYKDDFIYESNKGHDVFFVATEDEAVDCLCR